MNKGGPVLFGGVLQFVDTTRGDLTPSPAFKPFLVVVGAGHAPVNGRYAHNGSFLVPVWGKNGLFFWAFLFGFQDFLWDFQRF